MAQKNLVNVPCSSTTEVFRHIRDWLAARSGIVDYSALGIGLTVHDSYYASGNQDVVADGDWVVFMSPGESGKRAIYFRLLASSLANGIVRHSSGLSWNATTNAWEKAVYSGQDINCGPTTGTSYNVYVYASLDHFHIIIGNVTTLYGRSIFVPVYTMHDNTIALTTAAIAAGSNVVVPFDAVPTSWAVGKAMFIASGVAQEKATITAINGLNVTVASLTNGYSSGSRAALDMTLFISSPTYFVGQGMVNMSHSDASISNNYVSGTVNASILSAADPDPSNSCHATESIRIAGTLAAPAGDYGVVPHVVRVPSTGLTSGSAHTDEATGNVYRVLAINEAGTATYYAFREV